MAERRLEGKVALVTGAGTGIGAAIARRFAAEGARLVLVGRRPEPLETLAAELGGLAVPGSAAVAADARGAVDTARERLGRLDVVVANAGGAGGPSAGEVDDETWASGIEANLTSALVTVREALPALLHGGEGAIVIVSSIAALAAVPATAGYSAAKAGLLGLTRSLALDYGPRGVRVNAVCPGWVRTPLADAEMDELAARRGISREDAYLLATSRTPLRRPADPAEIAACCLFLASSEASFVTGSVLVADGGSTAVDVSTLDFG